MYRTENSGGEIVSSLRTARIVLLFFFLNKKKKKTSPKKQLRVKQVLKLYRGRGGDSDAGLFVSAVIEGTCDRVSTRRSRPGPSAPVLTRLWH